MQTVCMRSLRALTEDERRGLEAGLKGTKDLNEWRRLFVILGSDEGQSIEELSKLTRLSEWTIEDYLTLPHKNSIFTMYRKIFFPGIPVIHPATWPRFFNIFMPNALVQYFRFLG